MAEVEINEDELIMALKSSGLKDLLAELASSVAARAVEISEREAWKTGAFAGSISAKTTTATVKDVKGSVPAGRVEATDWKAHFIEYGVRDKPPVAPLRRAAQEVLGGSGADWKYT